MGVFLVSLAVLGSTVAPTASFWDCGEFITAAYTLGVPHPPGAPLYLMLGRMFSLVPVAEDIGLRVNLVSVLVSALTVMLLYLCIVRLGLMWKGREDSLAGRAALYGSAAVGALCFAFSHSFWWNAVEAEVYALSMFFTALVFYLALRWLDYWDEPLGNRLLLLIFYIIGLSSGVHLLNVLALISVALVVAFRKYGGSVRVFVIGGLVGAGAILVIYPGIVQGLPILLAKLGVGTVGVLLAAAAAGAVALVNKERRVPAMALLSVMMVVLGYSTFLMIKIRSGLDPFLDENDPETWSRLFSYLNREQYGTESLFLTMFKRKAPFWSYQINKMYLRYLGWQYLDLRLFYGIPFLLGVMGAVHQLYRDTKGAAVVLSLFIMTGLAIVLYLNQEDPQPRERDYAYVGSFFAFAIWIGLGAMALIESVAGWLKTRAVGVALAMALVLLAAAPGNMLAKNYHSHNRQGNYVAWDYSYNLLMTCAPDAILYTNGDNDTFPVWYLQEVAGVRRDVRVVNLSLLNTGWFIRQIRDKEPRVPMTPRVTDDYLENVIDSRDVTGLMDRRWPQVRRVRVNGPEPDSPPLVWDVPATLSYPVGGGRNETFLRVQDVMILNTIVAAGWQRPIYFAVTVSDGNLLGLRDVRNPSRNYLSMEGLAFRLHPKPVPLIDAEKMAHNLMRVYKYRNTNNPKVYYDDNILRLLGNYRQGLIQLAYYYLTPGEGALGDTTPPTEAEREIPLEERVRRFEELRPPVKALTALEFMDSVLPEEVVPIGYDLVSLQIGRLYAQMGKPEEFRKRLDRIVKSRPPDPNKTFEYGLYYLTEAKAPEEAAGMFDLALASDNSYENHQRIAMVWLQYGADTARAEDVLRRYLAQDDRRQAKLRVAGQALAMGMANLSFQIYEQLLQANPEDGEAVRGIMDYYLQEGQSDRARALGRAWLDKHPSDQAVKERLERAG